MTEQTVKAPIERVLLQEDRAFVTRRISLELKSGNHRLTVEAVAPVLSDKTLMGKLRRGTGSLIDVRPLRRPRVDSESESEEAAKCRERVKEKDQELTLLRGRQAALADTLRGTESLLARWLKETAQDVVWGTAKPKSWDKDFQKLTQSQSELAQEMVEFRLEIERGEEQYRDLKAQLGNLTTVSDEVAAKLEVDLELEKDGEVELELEYCVPGACWRPQHRAHWQDGRLRFQSQACVWQNTGEDWEQVQLVFSTQRAVLGTEPPRLERDRLSLQKRDKQVVLQTREESVKVLEQAAPSMPGIDDGGEVLTLKAEGKSTVRSDGHPHRVPLFSFECEAGMSQIVTAELALAAFQKTRQSNGADVPLLAGPVDLVKECGLVGRGWVDFVAPGQSFDLSWGPQPAVSVHREYSRGKEDSSILSGWKTRPRNVEIHLTNLGKEPQLMEVVERIPISELKEVKIEQQLKKTTDKVEPDEHGFLRWQVELAPRDRKTICLEYLVSKKKNVEGEV